MSTGTHTFSHMLRNSGDVLDEVEHRDVLLQRRDGVDVIMSTSAREGAVRGGLVLSARLLEDMLTIDALRVALLAATENALPWLEWLPDGDRAEFLPSFVRTVRACGDTGYYQALERLLGEWEASAQIQHDPGLRELLEADRGTDEGVKLKRPQK